MSPWSSPQSSPVQSPGIVETLCTSKSSPIKMEMTGKVIPSVADASTPTNIMNHSGAAALITRHPEGSGKVSSCSFTYINN